MKRLWLSLGVLALLFVLTLWNTATVSRITEDISQQLRSAESAAHSGDWDAAAEETQAACEEWQKHAHYFGLVLRHADTDQISTTFSEVLGLLRWQEGAEYSSRNQVLLEELAHLSALEQLSWENLL